MTDHDHPHDAEMRAYLDSPADARFVELRRHLMTCAQCRQQLDTMQQLVDNYAYLPGMTMAANDVTELHQQVDKKTGNYSRQGPELREALFYTLNRQADPVGAIIEGSESKQSTGFSRFWQTIVDTLTLETPLSRAVAVTAILVLGIALIIQLPAMKTSQLKLITFQDDAQLYMTGQNLPGMGFFHEAQAQVKPFTKPEFKLHGHELLVHWSEIESAESYLFEVYAYRQGHRELLGSMTTFSPEVAVAITPQMYNKRLEWHISGQTSDERKFSTSGGLVIGSEHE